MDYIALITISIILYYIFKILINKFVEYNMIKGLSGPKAFPLIGNLHLILGDMKDITNKMIKLSTKYTSPWRFWIGPKLIIIFSDPEYIEIIIKKSNGYKKNQLYEFFKPVLGNGLFTAPETKWAIHRNILNPGFKEQILLTYMDSILKNSNRLVTILETTNRENVNILHYVHLCTLDIIYDSFLSCDLDLQNNPECKLDEYMSEIMDIASQRIVKVWLHPTIIFKNSSTGKRFQELISHFNKITSEIIRGKKESMQNDKISSKLETSDARKITGTFLDLLLKSFYETGEYLERDIHDEIQTMVFAGSDTVAGTLAFLFLLVATFPEVQQQVYEELYQIYGLSDLEDAPITVQDIKKMKYLERVIKETLRLFPPGPIIGRILSKDMRVNENVVIPKNCTLALSIFTLHRDDKYWKEPLTFNPDRFLPGNHNPKCFLPFSSGRRDCIGQTFAMMEMKGIVATVLRKFIVRIDEPVKVEDVDLKYNLTLKPAKPILLRFYKR